MSNSNKKAILIPGWKVGDNSFGVTSTYLEWINQFGNPKILMPWEDIVKGDVLVLPGGADLNPNNYGQVPGYKTSNIDVFKQYFYDKKLADYINSGISIYGICLGAQALAVYFGSELKQNLIYHPESPDRWKMGHTIKIYDEMGKFIQTEDKKGKIVDYEEPVNSHHHQGILLEDLSDELTALAVYDEVEEETVVEVFKHKNLPIVGVQFHPEELWSQYSKELFESILK